MSDWQGSEFEVRLGAPGHGGFCVARHEGRVLFVRHGLPGELVRARVTEDRGGSFCRAEAVEILEASPDRVEATCPVSGPGGAGCCDFSFATPQAQRDLKAAVVAEQLRRLAKWEKDIVVEPIPVDGEELTQGWRSRMRLAVDADGRAGVHRYRGTEVITDLRCPQPMAGAMDGIAERKWTPGADLVVAVDGEGQRHIVEVAPPEESHGGRRGAHGHRGGRGHDRGAGGSADRRNAVARRSAAAAARAETVVEGSGRTVQYVADRRWELSATGFWQPHFAAAQCYSDVVADWAYASPGELAWDLYSGVGVFAARIAEQVGPGGSVHGIESHRPAVTDGTEALRDLPWIELRAERVERWLAEQPYTAPEVVVLDPPRAGAGKEVIAALAERSPRRIVHIGCDPASFARDINLYREAGYMPTELRAFDAFPGTHHVECLALLEL